MRSSILLPTGGSVGGAGNCDAGVGVAQLDSVKLNSNISSGFLQVIVRLFSYLLIRLTLRNCAYEGALGVL